uniref:Uncharacterized protein n=1 Tax=Triticum urartu TaxID=4572 RepID=A0A8R7PGK1_TRIUA
MALLEMLMMLIAGESHRLSGRLPLSSFSEAEKRYMVRIRPMLWGIAPEKLLLST